MVGKKGDAKGTTPTPHGYSSSIRIIRETKKKFFFLIKCKKYELIVLQNGNWILDVSSIERDKTFSGDVRRMTTKMVIRIEHFATETVKEDLSNSHFLG